MKKLSPWIMGGVSLVLLLGIEGFVLGLVLPGGWVTPEAPPSGSAMPLQALKKKYEVQAQKAKELSAVVFGGSRTGGSHRVFVSRPLIYLPKSREPVQPMDDQLVTEDGIQVGWKIKNQFDPEDPLVAEVDTDRDGFSNKEEYEKGTNPRNPASSPAKWVKIKIASVETNSLGLGFSGKSADRYTLRVYYGGKKKDVDVVVGDQLWLAASSKSCEIYKNESDWNLLKGKGGCPHAIPIVIQGYHEDKGRKLDEKTKTENDFDDSYLEIARKDALTGTFKILIDERGKSRGVQWGVGDIRLLSLVPGEGELGPFRVGQIFPYAGKDFIVRDAAMNKVTLVIKPDGEEVQILLKTP